MNKTPFTETEDNLSIDHFLERHEFIALLSP